MERVSLSERFGHIKAVTVDSSESDTDISDNDLNPKVSAEHFQYCDTTTNLSRGSVVQNTEKGHIDVDSDTEILEMEAEWMAHFQKILKKSRNLTSTYRQIQGTSLCDKVSQLDKGFPLQCLKNTLDQYNELSKDSTSNSVNDDLITDDLTIERNETELEICEDNVEETDNDIFDKPLSVNTSEQLESSVISYDEVNGSFNNMKESTNNEKNVMDIENSVENKTVEAGEPNCKGISLYKSAEQIRLQTEGDAAFDTGVNSVIVKEYTKETSGTYNRSVETHFENSVNAKCTVTVVSSDALLQECIEEKETSLTVKNNNHKAETVKTEEAARFCLNDGSFKEIVRINPHEKCTELVKGLDKPTEVSHTGISKKNKSSERIKDLPQKPGNQPVLHEKKEKAQSKKKVSQKCYNERDNGYYVVSQQMKSSKVKALEIKPALSFPLDELLPSTPSIPAKKRKAPEGIPVQSETTVIQRKRHTSVTCENNCNLTPDQQSVFEGNVFHGTVYDSSPKEDLSKQNSEVREDVTTSDMHTCDPSNMWDSSMTNLVTALQSGNQQVITMFQAALHDQIGSNLEALAFKARQNYSQSPVEPDQAHSFGFYSERIENTEKPDAAGDNESSDELLHLLVEQCSALVKTEEDRCKFKSLLKVLRKEDEKKFTSTGFTPPPEMERNSHYKVSGSLTETGDMTQRSNEEASASNAANELELFEGRTLLKGGVKPRHIPKTTVHKTRQDTPKDPRQITENFTSVMKLPLPEFAVELYGEKRVKQMVHLDWSTIRTQSVSVREKDPRMKKASAIDSNLKLIVDATKTLIENLQMPNENSAIVPNVELENNCLRASEMPGLRYVRNIQQETPTTTYNAELTDKNVEAVFRNIPVRITGLKQDTPTRGDLTKNRKSVMHIVDTAKSSNDFENHDKKASIGIVKPLVEQNNFKLESKPSVGIVKPIQVKSSKIPAEDLKKKNKISPLGMNRHLVSMELESDIEDGEIEGTDRSNEGKVNRDSKMTRDKRTCDQTNKKKTYLQEKVTDPSEVFIISPDVSCSEDGEIDSNLDTAFTKKATEQKKDNRNRYTSSRNYRKRDRSSSISSVDSRLSYSSRGESQHYISDSASRYCSYNKSDRRDYRSGSRNRYSSHHNNHRRRHHTSQDERSYLHSEDRPGAVKRHHSLGDSKRKRHRTEECRTDPYSDISLSDEDISQEYSTKFGHTKTTVSHSVSRGSELQWHEKPSQVTRKPRRKSLEEQQKEVLEDKKFLEYCKQKIVCKSGTVSATAVPAKTSDFLMPKQREPSAYRSRSTDTGALSYNDMLHLADLEQGDI